MGRSIPDSAARPGLEPEAVEDVTPQPVEETTKKLPAKLDDGAALQPVGGTPEELPAWPDFEDSAPLELLELLELLTLDDAFAKTAVMAPTETFAKVDPVVSAGDVVPIDEAPELYVPEPDDIEEPVS